MGNNLVITLFTNLNIDNNKGINVIEYATIFEEPRYHNVKQYSPINMLPTNILPEVGFGVGVYINSIYKIIDMNDNLAPQFTISFVDSNRKINIWGLSSGSTYKIV